MQCLTSVSFLFERLTVLLECFEVYNYCVLSSYYEVLFYSEWMVNQHRDSFASFIGHHDMVSYFSLVENESKARTKFNLMQVRQLDIQCLYIHFSVLCSVHAYLCDTRICELKFYILVLLHQSAIVSYRKCYYLVDYLLKNKRTDTCCTYNKCCMQYQYTQYSLRIQTSCCVNFIELIVNVQLSLIKVFKIVINYGDLHESD